MRRYGRFGVSDRVVLGFGAILIILVTVLLVTRSLFDRSAAAQQALADTVFPRAEAAQQLERSILYVGIGVRGYLLLGGAERRARHEENVRAVREVWDRVAENIANDPDARLIARAGAAVTSYLALADSLVSTSPRFDASVELALRQHRERALEPIGEYVSAQRVRTGDALALLATTRSRVEQGLAGALLVGALLAVAIAMLTASSIRRITSDLVAVATALRAGDWGPARRLTHDNRRSGDDRTRSRNELLQIARAFATAGSALESRDRRLQSNNLVCAATAASLDRREIADAVLREACGFLATEVGIIYAREPDGQSLEPIATRALGTAPAAIGAREGIPGEAHASGRTVIVRDIPPDSPFAVRLGIDNLPPRSIVAVPARFKDTVVGVLVVATLRDVDSQDVEFLEATAAQLAIGLQNASAYETVQQLLAEVTAQRGQLADQFDRLQVQHEELQAQNEEIQAQSEEIQAQGEEIQAQNHELQSQTSALRAADEQKDRFLGLLAHELRNPMSAISNSLFLLSHAHEDPSLGQRAQAIIERQTRQLTRLVDDLLDITRIARGKLHIDRTEIDLVPLLHDCIADHRTAAQTAGLTLDCVMPEAPLPVFGDGARLHQVVGNLLDNAIKFSPRGGTVVVSASVDGDARRVHITVRDNGIGIDAEHQPFLFTPFMQADPSRTRSNGGLGLGLSLVRAYVTLHGGTVSVRSDGVGSGCEFTVMLPLHHPHGDNGNGAEPSPAERSGDAHRLQFVAGTPVMPRRVLVVEDDADGAESLRASLALDGHDVRVAHAVEPAVQIALTFQPQVALCDVGLPELDGYEFARRVQREASLDGMLLVALTGWASPQDKQDAADAGFHQHLTKPATIEALRAVFTSVRERSLS